MICPRCQHVATLQCHTCGYTDPQANNVPHRSPLGEQLDWLTVDHDDLRQYVAEHTATPKYHPSMAAIDRWESESIARIRSIATRARRTLLAAFDQHMAKVEQTLNTLTPVLRAARQCTRSYDETDIQQWASRLQTLKKMPELPITVDVENKIYGISVDTNGQRADSPSSSCLSQRCDEQSDRCLSTKSSWSVTPGGVLVIREGEGMNDYEQPRAKRRTENDRVG